MLERRDIDELIILDIAATPNNRGPRFDEAQELCEGLFCPITIGGGIRNINDIRRLLAGGADKVAINTAVIDRPELIDEAARKFGSQAVVVSIDVHGGHVIADCGRRYTSGRALEWAKECERRGAGEILLTSIEHDGMMNGYDCNLIHGVCDAVSIPVVAAGGAGNYQHLADALSAGAHAVAVGAAFQFRELTPKGAARYLQQHGYAVRT
jgi:cyclase